MKRILLVPLFLAFALISGQLVKEQSSSDSGRVERTLSIEATQLQGELCGNNHACTDGLECVQVGLYKRCIPPTSCLARELRDFQSDFSPEDFKREMLLDANVTEEQIAAAAKEIHDEQKLNETGPIIDLIQSLREHVDTFAHFGTIVSRCSGIEHDIASAITAIVAPTANQVTSYVSNRQLTTPRPTPRPTRFGVPIIPATPTTRPPSPAPTTLTPTTARPTAAPTTARPTASPTTAQPTTQKPTNAPTPAPTPAPTIVSQQTVFAGFHVEGGALLEASVDVFFNLNDPSGSPPLYAKGCLGVGAAIGAELSLIIIVAETSAASEIKCLSSMYSVDLGVGLNLGYGLGVCLLTDPPFVYQEFTFGAGIGVGLSTFSMCNGVDTGLDLGVFGVGRKAEDNEEEENGNK